MYFLSASKLNNIKTSIYLLFMKKDQAIIFLLISLIKNCFPKTIGSLKLNQ